MNAALLASQGGVLVVYVLMGVLYHLLAPWWTTPYGRLVMCLDLALVGFSASGLATLIFGDYPGRDWVLIGLRLALISIGCWQICQLAIAQAYGELGKSARSEGSSDVQ